ncbi:hypothetical protein ACFE04_024440 [Oxalis oulophora]
MAKITTHSSWERSWLMATDLERTTSVKRWRVFKMMLLISLRLNISKGHLTSMKESGYARVDFNYQVQFTRTVCKNLHKNGVWIFPFIPPLGLALLIFQLLYHVNFDGKFYVGMPQKSKKQAEMSAAQVALRWA